MYKNTLAVSNHLMFVDQLYTSCCDELWDWMSVLDVHYVRTQLEMAIPSNSLLYKDWATVPCICTIQQQQQNDSMNSMKQIAF